MIMLHVQQDVAHRHNKAIRIDLDMWLLQRGSAVLAFNLFRIQKIIKHFVKFLQQFFANPCLC